MGRRRLGIFFGVVVALAGIACRLIWHPCGDWGWFIEFYARAMGYYDTRFAEADPIHKLCLLSVASAKVSPLNRMSYFYAIKTMLFDVTSRYARMWQDAPSFWLEKEVEAYLGAPAAPIAAAKYVSTGTAALVVALTTLGIGPGDEVVVPTYTWFSTASSALTTGAIPIMADIDETLGMDPASLRRVVTNRTKAVLAVHMRGVPCNIIAIKAICDELGLFLIEDTAQAFGASVHGRKAGTFGVMGITSVNPSKHFQAGGQGGLVWLTPDNDYLKERLHWALENGLASWGGLSMLPSYKRSFQNSQVAANPETPFGGHCFRAPSEWHAAFLSNELSQVDATTARLQELKGVFLESLHPRARQYLQHVQDQRGDRSYTITMIMKTEVEANALIDYLRGHGVNVDMSWSSHFLPHVNTLMKKVSFHASGFPWITEEDKVPLQLSDYNRSSDIMKRSTTIMIGYYMSKGMMRYIADIVSSALEVAGYLQ